MGVLCAEMTHILDRIAWLAYGCTEQLRTEYSFKLPDTVYFWKCPFNTLGLWLATGNQNLGKKNTPIRETAVFVDYLSELFPPAPLCESHIVDHLGDMLAFSFFVRRGFR